jgi:hypothetical protein
MSGNITANIKSIVDNLENIEWKQTIFEAITNSLHAGATNVDIKFMSDTLEYEDIKKKIDEIIVIDNGEGFTLDNTEAFQEYGTQHKKIKLNIGAKGVGRFLYLKIFNKVYIESLDKEIKFSVENDINVNTLEKVKYDLTKVYFRELKSDFRVNYDKLKDSIKEHFIAYFKLLKDLNKEVTINIYENDIKEYEIKSNDIPDFSDKEFNVNGHSFVISYVFNNEEYSFTEGFYCADDRVVIKNSQLDIKKKAKSFSKYRYSFFIII